jgi:hypothetical protein
MTPLCISSKTILTRGNEAQNVGFIVDFHSDSLCISEKVLLLINSTRNVT